MKYQRLRGVPALECLPERRGDQVGAVLGGHSQRQNILQRQFQADAPDRAWVSDVACVKINKNYLLSLSSAAYLGEMRIPCSDRTAAILFAPNR